MWKKDKKRIMMNEGDYGISLPITISGAEIAPDEKICFYIINQNYMVVLVKEYTNIENNTFGLCLTKNESKKLNQGCYRYKIDWCKDDAFKGTIVENEIFEVRKDCVKGILEEEEIVLNLQIKNAIPSKEEQSITYDEGFDGLGEVIIDPISEEYIIPTGTLEVTTNGEYDVKEKEKVNVNVGIDEYIITEAHSSNNIIKRIKKLPMIDLSGSVSMQKICYEFGGLEELPLWDTSNITNMSDSFYFCSKLKNIPGFNTSNVKIANNMCRGCSSLESVAELDFSNLVNLGAMFTGCTKLTTLGGFKNLGKAYLTTSTANYSNYTLDLSSCTLLTHESLMNVINNLYDIASLGVQIQKLVLGSTNLAKLTEEEIAIATNKGWAVS